MASGNEGKNGVPDSIREILEHKQPTEQFTLEEYREALEGVPPPTDQQIAGFAAFVCEAHSWYKHLPLLPPGVPFTFFLDPCSGCDQIHEAGGGVSYLERLEGGRGFHYTWMPTVEYRRRFGYLQYEADAAPRFLLSTDEGVVDSADNIPGLLTADGTIFRLPPEIARAGCIELTGVIHPRTARAWVWENCARSTGGWPDDTGGATILDRIWRRCRKLKEEAQREEARGNHGHMDTADAELEQLLEPERRRLVGEMVEAMSRMRSLLFG